jgi:uncharacterized protein (DUF302 family)
VGSVRVGVVIGLLTAVIGGVAGIELSRAAPTTDAGLITKPSKYSVIETVERLEAASKAKGLVVFGRLDHGAAAASVGLKMPQMVVVMFGNPRVGTPGMLKAPTLGIDLPTRALVWEDANGRVWLTYNSAEYEYDVIFRRHGAPAPPEDVRRRVEAGLDDIAKQATGQP